MMPVYHAWNPCPLLWCPRGPASQQGFVGGVQRFSPCALRTWLAPQPKNRQQEGQSALSLGIQAEPVMPPSYLHGWHHGRTTGRPGDPSCLDLNFIHLCVLAHMCLALHTRMPICLHTHTYVCMLIQSHISTHSHRHRHIHAGLHIHRHTHIPRLLLEFSSQIPLDHLIAGGFCQRPHRVWGSVASLAPFPRG